MFTHLLATILISFRLLPTTVEPAGGMQSIYATRAELATAMLLARNPNVAVIKNTGQYPDIRHGEWYEPYMLAAAKFGIVTPDPASHDLYPLNPVNRAEFLKMLALTFGIPTGYEQHYQDVSGNAWYTQYAGLAWKYHLFPNDDNPLLLHPEWLVTNDDASNAIQLFIHLTNQPSDYLEQQIAEQQAQQNLTLYNVISTRKTNVVFVPNASSSSSASSEPAPVTPQSLPQLRTVIVQMVNVIRLQHGLKPLRYNNQLEQAAQGYADRMATEGFFGHVAPDGQTLKDRIGATGYYSTGYSQDCNCMKGFALGENLGRGQKTPQEVMTDWMNSPSHRAAILNSEYADIGVGIDAGIWVQEFGGILLPGNVLQ
ncbi:MAG TPA: CAP domain-containing protein [Candidatus Peribacteraceae bacterium]|nr:CAP domain-containing protein [Candidatus Peribacteraceae bacterium]